MPHSAMIAAPAEILDLPALRNSGDRESLRVIGGSAEPRQFCRERFARLMQGRELLQDSLLELVCELPQIVIDVRRHGAHTKASSKSVEAGIGTGSALGDIRSTALAVREKWRGRGTPEGMESTVVRSELRRGISLVACRIAQTEQDGCHAATSSVFGNPAENEIGTCQVAGSTVFWN